VPRSNAAGGGVLGTGTARLPVVNAVATTPQLPFTGLSLLVATLFGGSLLLAGAIVSRIPGERGMRLS